ncbi:NAD(P)-binding domain-containing protein [Streptomyces sp. TG1A-8]|uniref:NAD(P)-binding domain-containing protein n=1 Tax=Streptomyces sp. TG1A-8 TaxID=3051385 RepID=UPI00265BE310|nr:NAD(P)-binding domain-containing protein [Streptomyces sp. TG1A-8]MDO0924456.1 NAD(P)-binding domain-containing protein [Streptomyces sp. TG1A-8]
MTGRQVGIVHPGAMGARVAAQAVAAGATVRRVPEGRSDASRERAAEAGLCPAGDPAELTAACDVVLSGCPPAAALDVARQVAATGFRGVYAGANAVSPRRMAEISEVFGAAGTTVVDGGITGPPPRTAGTTRLYLSGPAEAVARVWALFTGALLAPRPLPGPVGRASALKLAFAACTEVSHALAAQALALAEGHEVGGELPELAGRSLPGTPLAQSGQPAGAGPRAWRREPGMREIRTARHDTGLPGTFADAAAETFARWAAHKDDGTVTGARLVALLAGDDDGRPAQARSPRAGHTGSTGRVLPPGQAAPARPRAPRPGPPGVLRLTRRPGRAGAGAVS